MDALGSMRAALLGYSEGGPMCMLFAVTYPERTEALITVGSFPRIAWAPDYPFGRRPGQQEDLINLIREHWGEPVGIEVRVPSLAKDERDVLPSIQVPTLLLHPNRDQNIPVDCSRYMAGRIPGAKLIEIDSNDHLPFFVNPNEIPDMVQEFLTGGRGLVDEDRVLKTLMFSDIVGSTELATKLGDARGGDLRDAHHAAVRRELAIYRGQEVGPRAMVSMLPLTARPAQSTVHARCATQ